jgi:hypothetical protein
MKPTSAAVQALTNASSSAFSGQPWENVITGPAPQFVQYIFIPSFIVAIVILAGAFLELRIEDAT